MARSRDGTDFLSWHGEDAGADLIRRTMRTSADRMAVLATVRDLSLSDCWIAAGFVRSAVWDTLHGFEADTPIDDIDVIYFDPSHADAEHDRALEAELDRRLPGRPWSVRNQARMHRRNGDRPYRSSSDAMTHWLETPTAVGVALRDSEEIDVLAPFGLDDLLRMIIRPTPHARSNRGEAFRERLAAKPWLEQWPRARLVETPPERPS